MTQILLNTLNNSFQEMTNKTSLNCAEKQFKAFEKESLKKDFNGMDKTSQKESMNFDKVFSKQLEKESADKKVESNKTEVESDSILKSDLALDSDLTFKNNSSNSDNVQSVEEIKTLTDVGNLASDRLKELMNTIAQKIESVIDSNNSVDTLATLKDLLSEFADETKAESSLDLTLARDINELINQLQKVVEKVADAIETSTEDSCTAVVEDLISTLDEETEFSLKQTEDIEVVDVEQNADKELNLDKDLNLDKELNVIKEQLLAYVNKVDSSQLKNVEENTIVAQKDFAQEESINIEFNSDLIDFSTTVIEENSMVSTDKVQHSEIEVPLNEESLKELNIESIKAETATSDNSSSFMEQQTPEEFSVRASLHQDIETFELKLDKTLETQNVQQGQMKPTEITPSKIIEQITKQMEGLQNNSKVNIVLNPESLGKVTVQLLKTGEGLSAQFTVASQEVKDMLMKGLDGLKDTLLAQGVGVENVSIKLSDTQKSSYNPDWTEQEGSRGGNKEQGRSNKDEKHKNLFEQMLAQNDEENGNV